MVIIFNNNNCFPIKNKIPNNVNVFELCTDVKACEYYTMCYKYFSESKFFGVIFFAVPGDDAL